MADDDPVVSEIFIDAEPELVYRFLTDGELMARWMGAEVEIDPRPGGVYRVGFSVEFARGNYVEVIPQRKVTFTWGYESGLQNLPAGSTLVEITLEERTPGTLVRLVHRGLRGAERRRSHDEGWRHYLARLKTVSEGSDPGPDPYLSA